MNLTLCLILTLWDILTFKLKNRTLHNGGQGEMDRDLRSMTHTGRSLTMPRLQMSLTPSPDSHGFHLIMELMESQSTTTMALQLLK